MEMFDQNVQSLTTKINAHEQSEETSLLGLYDKSQPGTNPFSFKHTCPYHVCTPCKLGFTFVQKISDCAKHTLGCVIYLLCYPFIPCVVAILPSCCQIPGYPNVNPLYSFWGGSCCQCPNCCGNTESKICNCCKTQNCYFLFISFLLVILCFGLWNILQDYDMISKILFYFEAFNKVESLCMFVFFFTLVSFPMMWGYFLLNLTAGYIFGFLVSIPVVIFSVTIGVTVAHIVCKKYMSSCVLNLLRKRSNFEQIEAMLQVISGPSGFKVIALTRLTPIPFGFQNGIFSVSNIDMRRYLLASNIGLLPTQTLNCYIGSTFRSIEQLVEQENPAGYFMFLIQIAVGVCLMMFVVRHARKELAAALKISNTSTQSSEKNPIGFNLLVALDNMVWICSEEFWVNCISKISYRSKNISLAAVLRMFGTSYIITVDISELVRIIHFKLLKKLLHRLQNL